MTFLYYAHNCPPYWPEFLRVFSTTQAPSRVHRFADNSVPRFNSAAEAPGVSKKIRTCTVNWLVACASATEVRCCAVRPPASASACEHVRLRRTSRTTYPTIRLCNNLEYSKMGGPMMMSSDNGASAIAVGMRLLEQGASALDVRCSHFSSRCNHCRTRVHTTVERATLGL